MSYQQRNSKYRDDGDIDRIVDSSYGFLSDMPGGDTLPRNNGGPKVNVVSWDDKSRAPTKEKPKLRYWEPRIKSVRDIPQEQLPPPRKPRQRLPDNVFSSQQRSQPQQFDQPNQRFENRGNNQNDRPNIRYDEPKMVPSRNQHGSSMSQYDSDPRSQYAYKDQYNPAPRNQYAHTPKSQYDPAPKNQYVNASRDQYDPSPRNQYNPVSRSQYDSVHRNQYPNSPYEPPSQYPSARNNQYEPNSKNQYIPPSKSQYEQAPKSQYVPTPKPPENWKKPAPPVKGSNDINKNPDDVRTGWQEISNPTNKIIPDSSNQLEGDDRNRNGSSLLNRTNHYLEAVGKMKNEGKEESVSQQASKDFNKTRMTKLPEEVDRRTFSEDPDIDNSERRKSIADRIEDLNKNVGPAPPPLPPPIQDVATVTFNRQTDRPQLSYISQIKNGRQTLRSVRKIMDGPDQTNQPEPKNFKEKLTRLLDLQIAAQRRNNPPVHPEDHPSNVNRQDMYNTIKTLGRAAMKDKLEVILQQPPKKPSFRGVNDIPTRKEPATRLKFTENKPADWEDRRSSRRNSNQLNSSRNTMLSRQPSNAEDYYICHACGSRTLSRGVPNVINDHQQVIMENVFERRSKDSYM